MRWRRHSQLILKKGLENQNDATEAPSTKLNPSKNHLQLNSARCNSFKVKPHLVIVNIPIDSSKIEESLGLKMKIRDGKLVVKRVNSSHCENKIYPGDVM